MPRFELPIGTPDEGFSNWFKQSGVPGMYKDGHVWLNPHLQMDDKMRESIIRNETVRGFLDQKKIMPVFDLTPRQTQFFMTINGGKPYGNMDNIRHTILARILAGDDSAQDVTDEQSAFADIIRQQMGW